jgi:cytochrome c peroxidase
MKKLTVMFSLIVMAYACSKQSSTTASTTYAAIKAMFGTRIDPNNLLNYANQTKPAYITKDNCGTNTITDAKATLGRVLFYDKNLSIDNTISCGSCHKQEFAFSDTAIVSKGVQAGITGRHSMRLVNARFSTETKFFWDERAASLEAQTTTPIKDHAEMGFSGQSGRSDINGLISKLSAIDYYKELFQFVYGNTTITEQKLQECLSSFVRSIQSFDSKYDVGRAAAPNDGAPFQNFTQEENLGKQLFLQPPQFDATGNRTGGGVGCQGCHRAPEFDIDPNSRNNGITGRAPFNTTAGLDLLSTRSPSLRDMVNAAGGSNGGFMHTGGVSNLQSVLDHYNTITPMPGNNNLDPRLMPGGNPQRLNLTQAERSALIAFLRTLSGTSVYGDVRWGNPF